MKEICTINKYYIFVLSLTVTNLNINENLIIPIK